MMYKTVPAGGDTVCGYFVPGGTKIGWSSWGMMRDPKVWGADSKIFRPERWLDGTVEELNADMVFGWGRFQCLGKSIAYIELNKIFVEVCNKVKKACSSSLMVECVAFEKLRIHTG